VTYPAKKDTSDPWNLAAGQPVARVGLTSTVKESAPIVSIGVLE
jgi:hypothetical protein